jgi:FkbM family methyltransferase
MSDSQRAPSLSVDPDLIFDVGFCHGFDTAHYLDCGFRVVAVEADPVLVEAGRRRFEPEIASGRLTLLGFGIAEQSGTGTLWAVPHNRGLNSFIPRRLTGHKTVPIEVRTRTFAEILDEHGVPFYLKIDIEGSDHLCLEALRVDALPTFVSFELSRLNEARVLRDLGYSRFKILTQSDHRQFPQRMHWKTRLRLRLRHKPTFERLTARLLPRFDGGRHRRHRALQPGTPGPSGPFGNLTDGTWVSWDDLETSWRRCFPHHEESRGSLWFDLHASLEVE